MPEKNGVISYVQGYFEGPMGAGVMEMVQREVKGKPHICAVPNDTNPFWVKGSKGLSPEPSSKLRYRIGILW